MKCSDRLRADKEGGKFLKLVHKYQYETHSVATALSYVPKHENLMKARDWAELGEPDHKTTCRWSAINFQTMYWV